MNNITIGQIVGVCGTLTVLAGFFFGIYKFIKKVLLDKITKNSQDIADMNIKVDKKIEEIQEKIKKMQEEQEDSKEERLVLLKGLLACLKGLKEQGCNGPVTQGIHDIEEYIISKSHE